MTRDGEKTPVFTFEYEIPHIGRPKWVFTKTGNTGGIHDWGTPVKPKPDPDVDDKEGDNSQLIMIALIVILAAAVAASV